MAKIGEVTKYKGPRCRDCAFLKRSDNPRFGYCENRMSQKYKRLVPVVLFACGALKK